MFPISDDDSARRTLPVVTYALIALNILVFFIELSGGDAFIKQWAFVPSRFISNPASEVPTIFTGVLGAYIVMFPAAKVNVLVARQVVALPAVAVLGFWIVLQLFSGVGSIAQTADTGGVAYMAHVGGFAAGLLMSFLFRERHDTPSAT